MHSLLQNEALQRTKNRIKLRLKQTSLGKIRDAAGGLFPAAKLLITYYTLLQSASKRNSNSDKRPILVVHIDQQEFEDIHDRRYFYLLIRFLVDAGYFLQILQKITFYDFAFFGSHLRSAYFQDHVRIVKAPPSSTADKILLTNFQSRLTRNKWKKVVKLDCNISSHRENCGQSLVMPYMMHPLQYQLNQQEQLPALRKTSRNVRVFFSGNLNPDAYSNHLPGNKMTRSDIFKVLRTLPNVIFVQDSKHFSSFFVKNHYFNTILINDRRTYAIPDAQWLSIVAQSDFFLAPPGYIMPMCHNAIEAMAVGTIPILNYTDWFCPMLQHGKDCIQFDDAIDLQDQFQYVLGLKSKDVEKMRHNVIGYYEHYLAPSGFRRALENNPYNPVTLIMNTEQPHFISQVSENSVIIDSSF